MSYVRENRGVYFKSIDTLRHAQYVSPRSKTTCSSMEFLTVIPPPLVLKVGKNKGGISVTVRKTLHFYLGKSQMREKQGGISARNSIDLGVSRALAGSSSGSP